MAIKIRIPKSGILGSPLVKAALAVFLIFGLVFFGIFAFFYIRYQKIVDERMKGPIFANSSKIFAAPRIVRVGQKIDLHTIATELRHAGYSEQDVQQDSKLGVFHVEGASIRIRPGVESYYKSETTVLHTADGRIDKITSDDSPESMDSYDLEPQLVTGLFDDKDRSKRRLIAYDDLPKIVVDAVLSIEDRRFFQHGGVNYVRLVKAAFIDVRAGKNSQGASTITMQTARGFFLNREKTVKRKLAEIMIAIELEQRFSKKQILELYVNQIDMGQRGSFSIKGFGEASQAYFGKDIKSINLPEAALLAGIIKGPSEFSPYRHPAKALERRNLVLQSMVENNVITQEEADKAKAAPLNIQPPNADAGEAPYFVDLVRDDLENRYQDVNQQGYRIYTTLDLDLQKAAVEAVEIGMAKVDAQIEKRRAARHKKGKPGQADPPPPVLPQVALIALDPHTGRVLALVGGRNYGMSQLNHIMAKRPTGSIFKPFVYAAAINSDLSGQNPPFTPISLIDDSPTTFTYGDQVYTPRNYEEKYHGQVTTRYALAESLNNATVKLAEMTGYNKVADLAHSAGIQSVKATPAMALGAYDATPFEMAGAYTVFANSGVRLSPTMLSSVRDSSGQLIENFRADSDQRQQVLDPRVAYVVTSMMEGVLNFGTGYAVRQMGFTPPAAGKTGTSHDAWFAGYTSNLLCIVWVGNDDYTDLHMSGGTTSAPIWAEFMKRAVKQPQYAETKPFSPPPGVVTVQLDKITNLVSNSTCPDAYYASFLAGTEPTQTCDHFKQDERNIFQKILGFGEKPKTDSQAAVSNTAQPGGTTLPVQNAQNATPSPDDGKKKKGILGRIFGALKGGDDEQKNHAPSGQQSTAPN